MKKIFLALLVLLSSQVVHASLTRLLSFGTHPVVFTNLDNSDYGNFNNLGSNLVNGSLWIDDEYNMFYNPAYVFEARDKVLVSAFATPTNNSYLYGNLGGAEVGFFKSFNDNFVFGVYLFRGDGLSDGKQEYLPGFLFPKTISRDFNASPGGGYSSRVSSDFLYQDNIDLFLASDWGLKWGLRLTATNPVHISKSYYELSGGLQFLGLEPYFTYLGFGPKFTDSDRSDRDKCAEGNFQKLENFGTGLRFRYENWSPYIAYKRLVQWGTPCAYGYQIKTLINTYSFGLGHSDEILPKVVFTKHIGLMWNDVSDDTVSSYKKSYTQFLVPLNLALEANLTDSTTVRTSASYNAFNKISLPQNPVSRLELRLGASFKYRSSIFELTIGNHYFEEFQNFQKKYGDRFFALLGYTYNFQDY